MIKKNKWKLILSSVVILLPIVVGLIIWNTLPEQLATHWGVGGEADGWSARDIAVFVPPVAILLLHWLCVLVTAADPKNKGQSRKAFGMVLWICPVISVFCSGLVYAAALGMEFDQERIMPMVLGFAFAVIGNYLPKVKQNYTIGIKVPWAIRNEENWNMTHRFGGKVWVIGGLALMFCGFLPEALMVLILVVVIAVMAVAPTLYSYLYHRKQVREGTAGTPPENKYYSVMTKVSLAIAAVILVFVGIMLFSGDIALQYEEASFTIQASYWKDLTVDYAAVDSIEYREERVSGSRTNGFGSPRLLMGTFQNDEFGYYTRYTYTGCDAAVVLYVGDRVLVLSGADAAGTQAIYEQLAEKIQ